MPVSDAGQPVSGPISADSDSTTLDFVQAVAQLLDEINLKPSRSRGLLTGATTSPSEARLIEQLLASAQDRSEDAYSARVRELAFLANTLMSGCSVQGRAFTREEASDAAAGICNIGLEQLAPSSENFLVEHDLVSVFETGWRVLHQDVSLFIGRELLAVLRHLRCSDAEIQSGLHRLEHALTGQIAAGTPWRAREHLEVLAMLDVPVWISVSGLLDECPVMPAAMTAILDRRSGAVSASAFEFVGTMGQVQRIQDFAGRLDSLLR